MKKTTHFVKMMLFLCLIFTQTTVFSQETLTGKVLNQSTNQAIPIVNVLEKGTSNGTTTDFDGNFSIQVASLPTTLIFSVVGFTTQELEVSNNTAITVNLQEGATLDEIVIVGNRAKPRTILESPVAIDNISSKELAVSAQPELDKMIAFRVPSYNSTQQTISDATAHFDPSELRNLGPSRTLVLVNGKRKNQSALVYVQETAGRGEVGVDMKSIPAAAIERVEVLRDGASAQYGSDAIAGVINIILKENVEKTSVSLATGVTTEGDGFTYSGSLNTSITPDFGGYINFTTDFYHQEETNRAASPGRDLLFGNVFQPNQEDVDNGEITQAQFDEQQAFANTLLDGSHPWIQDNPDLGMNIGQPKYDRLGIAVNAGFPYADDTAELYTFGNFQKRVGKSFAVYRAPYWIPDEFNLLHEPGTTYQGFQPTFETDIRDNSFTLGNKWQLFTDWNFDISYTFGRSAVDYEVNNSINLDLGASSPTSFRPGGYSFSNHIGNLDIAKSFGSVTISLGSEWREERFVTKEGEAASYAGSGVQSFPGLRPQNALKETRSNIGVYGGIDWDITEAFLISSAGRYEEYSDFGENVSWKVAARYLLEDNKGAIRASVNTGFRAPSLHQFFLSTTQTLQLENGEIGNQGTLTNNDPVIADPVNGLGVPPLDVEESFNIAGGVTYRFAPNFSVALDYYNIKVDNRVLFTNRLGADGDDTTVNAVEQILLDNGVGNIVFFVNAVDTKTQGLDIVVDYKGFELGDGKLDINAAFNWNETDIDGTISVPQKILEAGYTDLFNREEQSRITTARPNLKGVLGLSYDLNKFTFVLNNTYFGDVTWQHPANPAFDQTFAGKVLTDISVSYRFADWVTAKATANNVLNVYPDEIETFGDFGTDLGGRFQYPWEVNQFGFTGTILQAGLDFKF
ncbi:TonB-dependent receptor [Aquimarina sp. 2201CG1-2-11]|uniref:TonB-dependent receptor n=1 Tax=Aquimarina discodermiae TaxID=3231043 RepID=UPI00346383F6